MSVEMMTLVLKHAEFSGGEFVTLLCLANCAWKDGTNIYPGVKTLADDARLSERQVRRCLARLEAAGVIIKVSAPTGKAGINTSYRIDIGVLEKGTGGQGVRQQRELTEPCEPVDNLTTGHLEHNPQDICDIPADIRDTSPTPPYIAEPSLEPSSHPSSRAREGAAPQSGQEAGVVDRWPEVWRAFKLLPGFPDDASQQRARLAWCEMRANDAEFPDDKTLLRCITAYGGWLKKQNSRRKPSQGDRLVPQPHNWLRDRKWAEFLNGDALNDDGADENAHRLATAVTKYPRHHKQIIASIGAAAFAAWFWDTEFFESERRIEAPTEFRARSIGDRFGNALRVVIGEELVVEVRKQTERAA